MGTRGSTPTCWQGTEHLGRPGEVAGGRAGRHAGGVGDGSDEARVLVQERRVVVRAAQVEQHIGRVLAAPHVGDEQVDERGVGGHGDLLRIVLDLAEVLSGFGGSVGLQFQLGFFFVLLFLVHYFDVIFP